MDHVNRLPVDVAERSSTVRKDKGWGEGEGCMDQESRLSCAIPQSSYVARASSDAEVIYLLAGCRFRFLGSSFQCWPWPSLYVPRDID